MKTIVSAALSCLLVLSAVRGQSPSAPLTAADSVQQSESKASAASVGRTLTPPAGTPLEIEAAYTVNSYDAKKGDFLSFRVLVPVKVDDLVVIDKGALVTARVVEAKRGGHWGRAGKLAWVMQDVVAVDLTRVPLTVHPELPGGQQRITGTSYGGQVATTTIILGALLGAGAPLALISGFKRGDNAVLPEGKRGVVYIKTDTVFKNSVDSK